jgi:transposase
MRHFGLDVHKRQTTFYWMDDETGEVSRCHTVPSAELVAHLASIPGPKQLVLECGTSSRFLAGRLSSLSEAQVLVLDAYKAKRTLQAWHPGRKTDKLDAKGLARLSYQGAAWGLAVWVPDAATRDWRALTRTRQVLVAQAAALQNQVRSFLQAEGLQCTSSSLLSRKGARELAERAAQLSPLGQQCLASLRAQIAHLKTQVAGLHRQLRQRVEADPRCALLRTIPGCGLVLAAMIVAEIGERSRFESAQQLRSYAGLTPSISQSGERSYTGPLTRGNPHLKYALVLLAQHFSWDHRFRESRYCGSYYRCLHQYGPQPAKVALARHLCDVIYALLRDQTVYRASRPAPPGGAAG